MAASCRWSSSWTRAVDLRYWNDLDTYVGDGTYAANLPTSATATTGPGPIVATVTHHLLQYQAPPTSNALLLGTWAFVA